MQVHGVRVVTKKRITIDDFNVMDDEDDWWRLCPICYSLVPALYRQKHLDWHSYEGARWG